jgi:cytochrome c553
MNLARMLPMFAAAALCLLPAWIAAQQKGAPAAPPNPDPQKELAWAYPINPPGAPAPAKPADDGAPRRVPGSNVALTLAQIRDLFNPPDWHPGDHPPMPEVVGKGRRPDVRACGYCHLPNGQGRPENSSLAGLPAGYIMQQMADYRNGHRKSAEPRMGPPSLMLAIGRAATEEEARIAAEYFASIRPVKWIRVVEQAMVPKTRPQGGMMVVIEGGGTEPIGNRIIETPENLERTELRDARSGFIAYVPPGSVARGRTATTGGGGKTIQCSICHGANLKGLGNVPPLAGRSPSYIVRQMFDIQTGNRNGPWTQLMKEAVAKLTTEDFVSLAAYTASLEP